MSRKGGTARVLVVATGRWVSTARLAGALRDFGCRVEFIGLQQHPARVAGVFDHAWRYDPIQPLKSLENALRNATTNEVFDTVIPLDELALMHLKDLAANSAEVHALLERSVGGDTVLAAASSRMLLLDTAQQEGVPVPETVQVAAEAGILAAVERLGLPLILKGDATSGGRGVRVASSVREARREWRLLGRPPSLLRAIKRGLTATDWTHLRPWMQRIQTGVTAQRFIEGGKERTGMALCKQGSVAAFVCLEVLESWCERGPSSLVRVIDDPAMETAMRRVAARLGVTGFCGFDFMLDPASGSTLLIEMNPRPTQLIHLSLGPGRDLVAAYVREILGEPVEDRRRVAGDVIALFPLALERGTIPPDAFHDVPWELPNLIGAVLKPVPDAIRADARWTGGKL